MNSHVRYFLIQKIIKKHLPNWFLIIFGNNQQIDLYLDSIIHYKIIEDKKVLYSDLKKSFLESLSIFFIQNGLKFIGIRPRSAYEVRLYLQKKNNKRKKSDFEQSLKLNYQKYIDQTIEKLKIKKYLDDYRFAISWVKYRNQHKPKGKIGLKQELIQKGISETNIQAVLSNQAIFDINKSKADLKKLIPKFYKKIKYKNLSKVKLRKLLLSRLMYRGYDYSTALSEIDEFILKG